MTEDIHAEIAREIGKVVQARTQAEHDYFNYWQTRLVELNVKASERSAHPPHALVMNTTAASNLELILAKYSGTRPLLQGALLSTAFGYKEVMLADFIAPSRALVFSPYEWEMYQQWTDEVGLTPEQALIELLATVGGHR